MKPFYSSPSIVTAFTLSSLVASLSAGTITWNGSGGDTNWTNGSNWGGSTAPANDTTTDIAQWSGGVELDADRSVNGLDFTGGASLNDAGDDNTLTLGSGGIDVTGGGIANIFTDVVFSADSTITLSTDRISFRDTSTTSGAGKVTITGGNTAYFDVAASSRTGDTEVAGGAIASIKGSAGLGSGTVILNNGTVQDNNTNYNWTSNVLVNAGGGTLKFNGQMQGAFSGVGALTIVGEGAEQEWSGESGFHSGGVTLDNVRARTNNNDTYGAGTITLKNGSIIKNRNNNPDLDNDIVLDAEGGGGFMMGWSNKTGTLSGVISGDGPLTFHADTASSQNKLTGTNTYTGETIIGGTILTENAQALGDGGAVTLAGGELRVGGNVGLDLGTRAVSIASDSNVRVYDNNLTIKGAVVGTGKLTVLDAGGSLRIQEGSSTYSGGTEIQGLVNVKGTNALGTGLITLNDVGGSRGQLFNWNGGSGGNATASLDNDLLIHANGGRMKAGWDNNLTVTGVASGTGELRIVSDSGRVILNNTANTFSGNIVFEGSDSRITVGSLGGGDYSGTISGDGTINFAVAGTQIISSSLSHNGATEVTNNGLLTVNGAFTGTGTMFVKEGATVGGIGSLGITNIESTGNIAPGNSTGTLGTGNLTLAGAYEAEITGAANDTIAVTGAVDVTGATLDLILSGVYTFGQEFILIDNDGVDAITGTFEGLNEGDIAVSRNGYDLIASYVGGGDNNDFILTVVPEPSSALLAGLGALALLRRRRA